MNQVQKDINNYIYRTKKELLRILENFVIRDNKALVALQCNTNAKTAEIEDGNNTNSYLFLKLMMKTSVDVGSGSMLESGEIS